MRISTGIMLIALAGTAEAQQSNSYVGGNELYKWCTTKGREASCLHYVVGVSDAIDMFQELKAGTKAICVPNGVTDLQLRDVVLKYLNAQPETRHSTASSLVWAALREVWPCR